MRGKALMSNSLRIAWKDLMELFRNRLGLVMLVLMPIFMMGMVGFIFPSNNSLNHVSVALVNQDAPVQRIYYRKPSFPHRFEWNQ